MRTWSRISARAVNCEVRRWDGNAGGAEIYFGGSTCFISASPSRVSKPSRSCSRFFRYSVNILYCASGEHRRVTTVDGRLAICNLVGVLCSEVRIAEWLRLRLTRSRVIKSEGLPRIRDTECEESLPPSRPDAKIVEALMTIEADGYCTPLYRKSALTAFTGVPRRRLRVAHPMLALLEGREPEEGANGRQAQVARPDAGASLCLEISEERADERRVGIVKGTADGGLMEPRLCKREQQPERVLWDAIVLALTLR
jgi:hypothetical protein